MTQIALLDTNIIIAILRRDSAVYRSADSYLREHLYYHFSTISQDEVLRGIVLTDAVRQRQIFDQLCSLGVIVPLNDSIIERAATIYADLYRRGQLIGDADILIAATALVNNWRLVTDNERHLRRVPGLVVENWLSP